MVRISTTAYRLKARNLARDPRAALHASGQDFWHYAVAMGDVTLGLVAAGRLVVRLQLSHLHGAEAHPGIPGLLHRPGPGLLGAWFRIMAAGRCCRIGEHPTACGCWRSRR